MTAVAWHIAPAGDGDMHWLDDLCPCGPEIEVKSREDGGDGSVIVHRAFDEVEGEEAA